MADISDKMAVDPYVLAATLAGHEQDVRAVGPFGSDAILTGSRDASMRLWRHADGEGYKCEGTLLAHTHYVIAVCATPSGSAASGSNDKHLIEWDLATGAPARVL